MKDQRNNASSVGDGTLPVKKTALNPGQPRRNFQITLLILIAFSAGAAVMVVELAAARILTPHFGQSVFVWTNVIGVILASIATGNYAGGRLADGVKSLSPLFMILLIAGGLCLAAPEMINRIARLFLGENLQLEEAFSLLVRGSFATTLIVFAPPVFLLGMALPFIVRAAAECYGAVGRASGTIYAASTLGSITGTFLTTYVLIEALGSRGTFYYAGLFLILLAGIGLLIHGRRPGRTAGLILVLSVCPAALLGKGKDAPSGEDVLWQKESRYQFIRIIEKKKEPCTLHLCMNEGLDSFHSIFVEGEVLTGGQYFDYYSLLPALAGKGKPGNVCIIGLAAGTIARQYAHFFGETGGLSIDGVEIDPDVIDAGYRFMDLGTADPWMNIYGDVDGRIFLDSVNKRYDVVIVDAYAQQIYIPFHLATVEFFRSVHDRLADGGILGLNVSGFSRDEPVIRSIVNSAACAFGSVSLARIPDGRNFMLYAVKGKGHVPPAGCRPESLPSPLRPLLEKISVYGLTRGTAFDSSKLILTDDRAPLELMSDRSLMMRSNALIESIRENG